MKAAIEVLLTSRPIERVDGEIAVAGFFVDDRPLRSGAARADWRLCGGLSRRIESGDLSGKSGEALLIGCGRALRSPRLMLLGLGDRHAFDQARATDEMRVALDRCRRLQCTRVAMTPLGIAPDDLPRHAAALVEGIREAWRDAERALRLRFCVPRAELAGVLKAFEVAARAVSHERFSVALAESERGMR
jgi:hypothetical protein